MYFSFYNALGYKTPFLIPYRLLFELLILSVKADMLDEAKVKGTNYDVLLKLQKSKKEGDEITSAEFVDVIKEALATWPKLDENLDYWKK